MAHYILIPPKIQDIETMTRTQKSFLDRIATCVTEANPIETTAGLNAFVRNIVVFAKKQYRVQITTPRYDQALKAIENNQPLTEKTIWGGVALQKVDVEKDFIQKLLVIKPYGVLGFEIHEKKKEHLEILEGVCLVFHVDHAKSEVEINVYLAKKGNTFSFAPRDEHGIITLTKTVIQETSTNHLDDLVYIFKASQIM